MYVDVHTHLTHEKFKNDYVEAIERAEEAGLISAIVNGLDPETNRATLKMAEEHKIIKAALGIYPVNAVNELLPADFTLPVPRFDVDKELDFIHEQAKAKNIIALGECGLDGYWPPENTFKPQERVFERFIEISKETDLPLIIHTRKLEERAIEILLALNAKKVVFHCFGGKVKLAKKCAEEHGWWFSIPANARVNQAFSKMLETLPVEKILTETDAPYLAPKRGNRNEPANVTQTIELLAELKGWDIEKAKQQVFSNYTSVFGQ